MRRLKVGIAGYGVVGRRRRMFIDQNPHFETVAVSDIRIEKEHRDPDGVMNYPNYDLLLNHDLNVVFICLPNYLAADATMKGLTRGLHVFCEKPPGRDLNDVIEVRKVEQRNPKLKLKYGFNHRYHDSFMEASKIVRSNVYGTILNIRGIYGKSRIIPFSGGWRSERKLAGGGILLDQGIHMLDMIRNLAGDFEEVYSCVSNSYWGRDVEDNAYALMRNKKGCVAMVHSTATQWQHRFRLEVTLEEAILELTGILSGSKSYGEEKLRIIPRDDESDNGAFAETSKSFLDDHSWKREIDEFAHIIIKNKKVENGNSLDAYKVMELVQRIYCADKQWKEKYNIMLP
jgi:predicted dehydrogenase